MHFQQVRSALLSQSGHHLDRGDGPLYPPDSTWSVVQTKFPFSNFHKIMSSLFDVIDNCPFSPIAAGNASATAYETILGITGNSYTWFVIEPTSESSLSLLPQGQLDETSVDRFAGLTDILSCCCLDAEVLIRVRDSSGLTADTGACSPCVEKTYIPFPPPRRFLFLSVCAPPPTDRFLVSSNRSIPYPLWRDLHQWTHWSYLDRGRFHRPQLSHDRCGWNGFLVQFSQYRGDRRSGCRRVRRSRATPIAGDIPLLPPPQPPQQQ